MIDALAAFFVASGGVFCLLAGLGIVRLGDIYLRMHAATKAGTLGLALICIGVMLTADNWSQVAEAVFVFLFMIATAPVGAHLVGRAVYRAGIAEVPTTRHDPDCDQFRTPDAESAPR